MEYSNKELKATNETAESKKQAFKEGDMDNTIKLSNAGTKKESAQNRPSPGATTTTIKEK